jgi:hypothetical protein
MYPNTSVHQATSDDEAIEAIEATQPPPTEAEPLSAFISSTKPMSDSTPSNSGPGIGGQALLKRRTGTSTEDFRAHYIDRHAPIAIPWCLANGVTYYAQVSESAPNTFPVPPTVTHLSPWTNTLQDPPPPALDLPSSRTQIHRSRHQPRRLGRCGRDGIPCHRDD